MFLECPVVESFWKEAITWWNIKRSDNINLNFSEILYGYKPESKSVYALNHYLLIAKYHIFLARNKSVTELKGLSCLTGKQNQT